MRPTSSLFSLWLLAGASALLSACGARTGLRVPELDAGPDAPDAPVTPDAPDVLDVVLPRPTRCDPLRLRSRVGSVVTLRPLTDVTLLSGYTWALRAQPEGSRARLFADGTDVAVITPDRVGTYETEARIASRDAPGGELVCPVTLVADPPDPRCPEYALVEPRVVPFERGSAQVAVDGAAWRDVRIAPARGAQPGGVLLDDTAARVAGFALELPVSPSGWLADAARFEAVIASATGASALLVGRAGRSPQGLPLRRTTLRIDEGSTNTVGALRDAAFERLYGAGVPAPTPSSSAAAGFFLEVTTVSFGSSSVLLLTVAPQSDTNDASRATAIRVNDLSNATPIARAGSRYEVDCHQVTSERSLSADFLWLVDTSGSMVDDQARVGRTGALFVQALRRAGIDYRLGVFQAGSGVVSFMLGGAPFRWVTDAGDPSSGLSADRWLAWQVTSESFEAGDRLSPYRISGGEEEPIAASIRVIDEFERRAAAGESNPDFLLRENSGRVAFLVTDEPGSNDYSRYFASDRSGRWGTGDVGMLVQRVAAYYSSRGFVPFGLVPYSPSEPCPSIEQLPACVILAAGGAAIPIEVADARDADRAFASAMERVTDVVIGAASEFVLPRVPMSASLRVRVSSRPAPRSRADGFDYEDRANTLVFRGASYRPARGEVVRTAYFYWL